MSKTSKLIIIIGFMGMIFANHVCIQIIQDFIKEISISQAWSAIVLFMVMFGVFALTLVLDIGYIKITIKGIIARNKEEKEKQNKNVDTL